MVNLHNLEITRILRSKAGLFTFAKYPSWHYEYEFLIQPDGKVQGKTSTGFWQELSSEATLFIRAKLQDILIDQTIPIS